MIASADNDFFKIEIIENQESDLVDSWSLFFNCMFSKCHPYLIDFQSVNPSVAGWTSILFSPMKIVMIFIESWIPYQIEVLYNYFYQILYIFDNL